MFIPVNIFLFGLCDKVSNCEKKILNKSNATGFKGGLHVAFWQVYKSIH